MVVSVRFKAMMEEWINLWSLDCRKFIHKLFMFGVLVLCFVCRNLWSINMLWSKVILSWWKSGEASTHFVVLFGWVFHCIKGVVLWLWLPICLYILWIWCSLWLVRVFHLWGPFVVVTLWSLGDWCLWMGWRLAIVVERGYGLLVGCVEKVVGFVLRFLWLFLGWLWNVFWIHTNLLACQNEFDPSWTDINVLWSNLHTTSMHAPKTCQTWKVFVSKTINSLPKVMMS